MNSTAAAIYANSSIPQEVLPVIGGLSALDKQIAPLLETEKYGKDKEVLTRYQIAERNANAKIAEATKAFESSTNMDLEALEKAIKAGTKVPPEVTRTLNLLKNLQSEFKGGELQVVLNSQTTKVSINLDTILKDLLPNASRDPKAFNEARTALADFIKKKGFQDLADAVGHSDINIAKNAIQGLANPKTTLITAWALPELRILAPMRRLFAQRAIFTGSAHPFMPMSMASGISAEISNNSFLFGRELAEVSAKKGTVGQAFSIFANRGGKAMGLGWEGFVEYLKAPWNFASKLAGMELKHSWQKFLIGTPLVALLAPISFIPGFGDVVIDAIAMAPGTNAALHSGDIGRIAPKVAEAGIGIFSFNALKAMFENPLATKLEPMLANIGWLQKLPFLASKGTAGVAMAGAGLVLAGLSAFFTNVVTSPFRKGGETAIAQNPGIQAPSLAGSGNPFQSIQEAQNFVKGIPGAEEAMKGLSGIKSA